MKRAFFYPVACLLAFLGTAPADDFKPEAGYTSLFNGKDLTGWKYGDVPPKKKPPTEVLDGRTASSDRRFEVKDGLLIAHDHGKGPNMAIFTAREFNRDFQLKLEFRTSTENRKNNSGVFIRGPQLQLDGVTEGGLTRVFRNLKHFKPGDWNTIEITVKGTQAVCNCNGEFVTRMRVPATGTIGLQSEIGQFAFRRIRVKELP
jgi:3-keto-disaccharide hydrolase